MTDTEAPTKRRRLNLVPDLRVEYRLGDRPLKVVAIRPRTVIEFESEFEMSCNAIFGMLGRTEHVPWMVWKQEHPDLSYEAFTDALQPGMSLLLPDRGDDDDNGDGDGDDPLGTS